MCRLYQTYKGYAKSKPSLYFLMLGVSSILGRRQREGGREGGREEREGGREEREEGGEGGRRGREGGDRHKSL